MVGGAALAGVAWEMDRRRRSQKVQEELEKLMAQRQQREEQRGTCQKEPPFEEFGRHLSKVFGQKLQQLRDALDRQPALFQLPVLGSDNPDFAVVAVICLFGNPIFQEHWPADVNMQFGLSVYALSQASAETVQGWLSKVARTCACDGLELEDEDVKALARLCLMRTPFCHRLRVKERDRRRRLAEFCRRLGFASNVGGGLVQAEEGALEFHSHLDGRYFEADNTVFWVFNFAFPNTWQKKTSDYGFKMQQLEGGFQPVGCQVTQPSRQQKELRFDLACSVLLRLEAEEVLRRLGSFQTNRMFGKCTGLTLGVLQSPELSAVVRPCCMSRWSSTCVYFTRTSFERF
ncbi:unnamed protein product [Symbiodinium natans]|uniref:Uncharacterized protein n=1 Tax=Symbiodinium natans TaxID=878477 RepID=A0A812H4H9_9DINO|nr:unnamed protein product [Symbiodinium natans]